MAPMQICQCNRGLPLGVSSDPPALSAGACLPDGREPTGNRPTLHRNGWRGNRGPHRSFAYSALACCRMGMSGSASFQSARKSW